MAILGTIMPGRPFLRFHASARWSIPLLAGLLVAASVPASAQSREAEARALINALGCKGCHRLENQGGSMGAPLEQIGERLSRSELRLALVGPGAHGPDSRMPSYRHLAESEIGILVDFLAGQR